MKGNSNNHTSCCGRGRSALFPVLSLRALGPALFLLAVAVRIIFFHDIIQHPSASPSPAPLSNNVKAIATTSTSTAASETIISLDHEELDNETKALCHRAHEFDSKASVREQISYIAKEGGLTSQMYQDATIISILSGSGVLRQGGIYADVAAAHPRFLSNSFVLDKCYGWNGVCVEADPLRVGLLKAQRSCKVVDTCVSEIEGEEVDFYVTSREGDTLSNGIANIGTATGKSQKMRCKAMSNVFREANITRVDVMSLDVESAEPMVLAGIDWSAVDIEIIVMEINKHTIRTEGGSMKGSANRIISILEAQNFVPVLELFPYHKNTMPIDDCSSVLLGQSVQSAFQPNRKGEFGLGVWRRQDVLFVRRGGIYEQPIIDWVHAKAGCG
mmetsp:Transcript_2994/g.6517  ORF Transcript_2994/g.6517 Transcript_2994/m.6517 type:complete len:387 (+) Transcript_2994:173-1333(+)|eukprot:CAMPEP_0172318330 /NCGR_PEP_ID=MMETSP1058-20130122/34601_1 /TAXON_ID=83371 /ORGANISM="Detonula confervacea, Strain CCMP 353" /LENGTH=386 /DNA_ID=CAMNT_0013033145 /DNA_START=96 /DNA_END=1256 /DNA_ORIENTATION=+